MTQFIEVTYLAEIECAILIERSIHDSQVIGVTDVGGRQHDLRVPKGELTHENGKAYLPIGIVDLDRRNRKALIELPTEAGSGYRRLWIRFDNFRVKREAP